MATKVDGIPSSVVLPALPTGLSLADPDEKAKYNESIQKVLDAFENRSQVPWFKMAAAFADPGRTGTFGEAFGKAMGTIGQAQEEDRARALPIAQMRAQLAGQQFQMSKEEQAFKLAASQLGFGSPQQLQQSLMTGAGTFGIGNRFSPDLYFMISKLDPKLAETIKNAAGMDTERMKAMVEATKMNMSIAQMYDQFGKEVTDRFMRLQGNAPLGQGAPTGPTSAPSTMPTAPAPKPYTGPAGDIPAIEDPEDVRRQAEIDALKRNSRVQPPAATTETPDEFGAEALGNGRFKLVPSGRIVNIDLNLPPKEQRARLEAEIKVDQELFKKREETDIESQAAARGKRGEPFQKKFDTVAGFDYNTVQSNEIKNRELIQLMKDHPDVVGQLVHQGPIYALLQAAESGITTPYGSLSLPVTEALNKLNLSEEKQAVARNALQLMSELNQSIMRAGKDIYGPQISAFDAQEMAKPGFKATDPMSFIVYLASKNIVTNKYLGEMAGAQQDYFDKNPKASTSSFFSAKNKSYTDIVDRYGATMRDLVANSPYRKK